MATFWLCLWVFLELMLSVLSAGCAFPMLPTLMSSNSLAVGKVRTQLQAICVPGTWHTRCRSQSCWNCRFTGVG